MRFYTQQHRHYCGVDLHSRSLFVCVLDQAGNTLLHRKLACDREALLAALKPYKKDLGVAVECLSHALFMKAIHGGKTKNDRIDSAKIASLLRGGNLPQQAYVYPREIRLADPHRRFAAV
jgi:hypothetical protein